ncbi:hypothetical protein MFLAVUS_000321 [Mucor flavus]|uniref:Nitrogen regulatory protein areA GATA-like domain-containing protein n=1 Tax=Mucor flavus TaxID=439312 RepID=A0ABP9YJD7_9FUNG
MSSSLNHEPFLSLSCNKLDANDFGNIWAGFSKCKSFIDHGKRLEYMSWRLWYCRQQNDRIDNNIKQIITSLLLSPAFPVHDAYSHEVSQAAQNCFQSTIQHHASINKQQQQQQQQLHASPTLEPPTILSRSSSFCKVKDNTPSLTNSILHTRVVVPEQKQEQDEEEDDLDDYEEDEDYYLSDDDDIYEEDLDDINYQFVRDFTKTQPRPLIPRRSLLSDLLQRVSSPPSLLSNSSSSFTSNSTTTQHSIILDDEFNHKHNTTASPNNSILTTHNEQRWKQSFRGW